MSTPRSKRFKTIALRDFNNERFYLGRTECWDRAWKANRAEARLAIRTYNRGYTATLLITRKTDLHDTVGVAVTSLYGSIRFGCHVFSEKASKKILKWAGVENV